MSFDPKTATIGEMEAWRAAQAQATATLNDVADRYDAAANDRSVPAATREWRRRKWSEFREAATRVAAMTPEAQP